ncbi:MAG: M12 family metallopeptidase [Bacteroidota bacterium]|nr:M12 family metallopeptidase [Bacteroidota bacterium]
MSTPKHVFEGYPDFILARIEHRDRMRRAAVPSYIDNVGVELVFEDLKLWQVGKLKVSFKGGSTALHKKIAEKASEWSQYGNIIFDFGYKASTRTYRKWKPNDRSHIRVGFEYGGYWSLVGTDSKDPAIANDGDITLNLNGFDVELPSDWAGTTLHEFGHAIGFHHEHQSPQTNCDFDWDKLYEYLAQPPNEWSKATVDHNLRQLPGGGLTYSPHDKTSIMHYSFPAWMFKKGKDSACFTARNNSLSTMDKHMMGQAYPISKTVFETLTAERVNKLEKLVASPKLKNTEAKTVFEKQLSFLKTDKESVKLYSN